MHVHAHGDGSGATALKWSLAATILFVAVQFGAGLTSGSLALLSDAGHNLTDALALALAWFGVYLGRKPADDSRTYGYGRGGVLAAFVNALALVALSVYLFVEAWERFRSPQPVHEPTMIAVAGLGIVLNAAIMVALHRHSHDLNIRAASIHMLGDALGSVAIIIGAVIIRRTGWLAIDPALSVLIGVLIIWTAVAIIRESLNILLEGMPPGMDLGTVKAAMTRVPGVLEVHDVHVWSLGSGAHALSCHARIADIPTSESDCILRDLNHTLGERFGIHHTTVQFEHEQCALPHGGCCIPSAAKAGR